MCVIVVEINLPQLATDTSFLVLNDDVQLFSMPKASVILMMQPRGQDCVTATIATAPDFSCFSNFT